MKKVLLTLCGAVLLMALVTAPALAGSPFWQSDLVCNLNGNPTFGDPGDALPTRSFAAILHPSGDLYVSKIFLGSNFPTMDFDCDIQCSGAGLISVACGKTDVMGTLAAKRIKGVATKANIGLGVCEDITFGLVPSGGGSTVCKAGFNTP